MAKTYRSYDQKQTLLLSPNLNDWLPERHLARFVSDTVETIDLAPLYDDYEQEERGFPPYDPAMMTKLLVYGYCVGVRSSRKIQEAVIDHVAFRWLAAGNQPRHSAVSDFRLRHIHQIEHLFVEVLHLARRAGLVQLATVSLDGSKMKANAALDNNRNAKQLDEELHRIVRQILHEAGEVDQLEDELYGRDVNPAWLPEGFGSKKERLARILEAQRELQQEAEAEKREHAARLQKRREREEQEGKKVRGPPPTPPQPDPEREASTTDAESRVMKTRKGFMQAYNAQIVVDTGSHLIVAAAVTKDCHDRHQQNPMLERVKQNCGRYPRRIIEDAGYWSEPEIRAAPRGVEVLIATANDDKMRQSQRVPAPRGRIPNDTSFKERMHRKLRTKIGRAHYQLRGTTVEPAFGRIKEDQGIRGFLLRSLRKVAGEWNLVTMSHNVKRMWRIGVQV